VTVAWRARFTRIYVKNITDFPNWKELTFLTGITRHSVNLEIALNNMKYEDQWADGADIHFHPDRARPSPRRAARASGDSSTGICFVRIIACILRRYQEKSMPAGLGLSLPL
jgi:hypothetical protein